MQNICHENYTARYLLATKSCRVLVCTGCRFYLEGVVNAVQCHAAKIGEHACDKFLQTKCSIS